MDSTDKNIVFNNKSGSGSISNKGTSLVILSRQSGFHSLLNLFQRYFFSSRLFSAESTPIKLTPLCKKGYKFVFNSADSTSPKTQTTPW